MQFYSKKKSEKRRKAIVEEYILYPSTPLRRTSEKYNISIEGTKKLLKKSGIEFNSRSRKWEQINVQK